jgi:hypothetical protein
MEWGEKDREFVENDTSIRCCGSLSLVGRRPGKPVTGRSDRLPHHHACEARTFSGSCYVLLWWPGGPSAKWIDCAIVRRTISIQSKAQTAIEAIDLEMQKLQQTGVNAVTEPSSAI